MVKGKWLRHTFLRASESPSRDGESRTRPGWPQGMQAILTVPAPNSSQPSLLTVSTWRCPDRDPSGENCLIPPSPCRYKPHFLLALLSSSPLPPPLHSILPPLSLLDVPGNRVRSLHGDTETHGAVVTLEANSCPTCSLALQISPRKVGKSLA